MICSSKSNVLTSPKGLGLFELKGKNCIFEIKNSEKLIYLKKIWTTPIGSYNEQGYLRKKQFSK